MDRAQLDALMDVRLDRGRRDARAWLRRSWLLLVAVALGALGPPAFVLSLYTMDPNLVALYWFAVAALPGVVTGVLVLETPRKMLQEARTDAALMELRYASARLDARDVEVGWRDRLRYAPLSVWLWCVMALIPVAGSAWLTLTPGNAYHWGNAVIWALIALAFFRRMLRRDQHEEFTKARVMYREAAKEGADLRGAFSLTTPGPGGLEMTAEQRVGDDVVFDLDEDSVAADEEAAVEREA